VLLPNSAAIAGTASTAAVAAATGATYSSNSCNSTNSSTSSNCDNGSSNSKRRWNLKRNETWNCKLESESEVRQEDKLKFWWSDERFSGRECVFYILFRF
jgi:hypothetical protein